MSDDKKLTEQFFSVFKGKINNTVVYSSLSHDSVVTRALYKHIQNTAKRLTYHSSKANGISANKIDVIYSVFFTKTSDLTIYELIRANNYALKLIKLYRNSGSLRHWGLFNDDSFELSILNDLIEFRDTFNALILEDEDLRKALNLVSLPLDDEIHQVYELEKDTQQNRSTMELFSDKLEGEREMQIMSRELKGSNSSNSLPMPMVVAGIGLLTSLLSNGAISSFYGLLFGLFFGFLFSVLFAALRAGIFDSFSRVG